MYDQTFNCNVSFFMEICLRRHLSASATTRAEEEETKYHQQFGKQPPRPPHWGGYKVKPTRIEFWQGRPSRLHDRINFTLENDSWVINRLAP